MELKLSKNGSKLSLGRPNRSLGRPSGPGEVQGTKKGVRKGHFGDPVGSLLASKIVLKCSRHGAKKRLEK